MRAVNLVNVYRGEHVESAHSGSIVVVDSTGKLLAYAGNPNLGSFLRSAAKPFQALPLLQSGAIDEFELTRQELALVCASHGGEPKHVATAAAILRKGEFDETDLQCGAHLPYSERAENELRASGEPPSPLHNNCSGKHAGMLLACQLIDAPPATYLEPDNPLQRRILETMADFAGLQSEEIAYSVDGCGVPAFFLSLYRAAFAYARLGASARDGVGALPSYGDSSRAVVDAMTAEPSFVAGEWSMTTPLIEAFRGGLIGKDGAEAFYGMVLLPQLANELTERLDRTDGTAIGVAIKIDDGSMSRARDPVVLETLRELGLSVDSPLLQQYRNQTVRNVVGNIVGEVKAEFELRFL